MAEAIERNFIGWSSPAGESVAAWLAGSAVRRSGMLDLRGTLVVVPGARARMQVLRDLRVTVSGPLLPPQVVPRRKMLSELFAVPVGVRIASDEERLFAACEELAASHELRGVLCPRVNAGNRAELARVADSLIRLLDLAARAGRSAAEVATAEPVLARSALEARWLALARLEEGLGIRLRGSRGEGGAAVIDPARATIEAPAGWEIRPARLVVAGIADPEPAMESMIDAVARRGIPVDILILAPSEHADGFDRFGGVRPDAWRHGPPLDDDCVRIAQGPGEQARQAVQCYAELCGESDHGTISLVCARDDAVPALRAAMEAEGRSLHAAQGRPLEQTEPGSLLAALRASAHARSLGSVVDTLSHPALARLLQGAGWPEMLADSTEAREPAAAIEWVRGRKLCASVPSLREAIGDTAVAAVDSLIGPWLLGEVAPAAPLKQVADGFVRLMDAAFPGDLRPIEAEALRRVRKACERFAEGPLAKEPITMPEFLALIGIGLDGTEIPEPTEADDAESIGWDQALFDHALGFVVVGANEGALPSLPAPDGWFTEPLRRQLRLNDRRVRQAVACHQLHALAARTARAAGGHGLKIVIARVDATGEPLLPSRLLVPPKGPAQREAVRRLLAKSSLSPDRLPVRDAAARSAFGARPDTTAFPERTFGDRLRVTSFARYIENPFVFWLESVLRLRRPQTDGSSFSPPGFGGLLHEAVRVLVDAPDLRGEEQIARLLTEGLDRARREKVSGEAAPWAEVQLREASRRLRALAGWEDAQRGQGWRIVRTELSGRGEIDVDGSPVEITWRADRIERNERTGAWRICDYKSASRAYDPKKEVCRPGHPPRWIDPQLPLYRVLVGQASEPGLEGFGDPTLAVIHLPPSPGAVELIELPLGGVDASGQPELVVGALDCAREVVRRIRAGDFKDSGSERAEEWDAIRRRTSVLPDGEDDEEAPA